MSKTTGIILAGLVLVAGLVFIGLLSFSQMGTYYGYEGYCARTRFPHFVALINLETGILAVFIAYNILQETRQGFVKNPTLYPAIALFHLLNMTYMTLRVVVHPIVIREHGWFRASSYEWQNMYNPLFFILILFSIAIAWWNYRCRPVNKGGLNYSAIVYLFVALALILTSVMVLNSKYEVCQG